MPTTGKLNVTARGEREIVITRTFDAPREMVFAAHTRPELVKRWMTGPDGWTLAVCEIDLRAGGRGRYVWRDRDNGAEMGMTATFREIEPPERIVHEELFDEDWTGGATEVVTTFTSDGERTRMEMVVRCASPEARAAMIESPMADGMEAGYARLDAILAADTAA